MNKLYPTIVFAALLALASGCNQDKNAPDMHGEDFVPNDTLRASQKFMLAQEASGARHDATLNAQHFNGKDVGSLGEQKLDLMMQDDDLNEPFTVYLDLPKGDATTVARQESVTRYLKDKGLTDEQIKIEIGENANTYSSTAMTLAPSGAPAPAMNAPVGTESPNSMGGGMK
jgi:uncharacterized UBP type Zn finger protein